MATHVIFHSHPYRSGIEYRSVTVRVANLISLLPTKGEKMLQPYEATLYLNDSKASEEAIKILSSLNLSVRRVPTNGPNVPTLLFQGQEFLGIGGIRLFAHFYGEQNKD